MTSARRQAPHHLEHTRVDLLLNSFSCGFGSLVRGSLANAVEYLELYFGSVGPASFLCVRGLPQKWMCRQVTHRGSDFRLDMSRFMGPDERSRRRLTCHVGTGDCFSAGSGNPAVTSQNLMAFSVTMAGAVVITSARTICADSLSINRPVQ